MLAELVELVVFRDCEIRRLLITPGHEWFPAEPSGPYVRLDFAVEDPSNFTSAASVLDEALRQAVGR